MKKFIPVLVSFTLLLVSCGGNEGDDKKTAANDSLINAKKGMPHPNSKEVILKKINFYDSMANLPGQAVANQNVAQNLITSYNEFVEFYPTDSLSQKFAYLSAKVAVTVYSDQQALRLIDNCLKLFPAHPERVQLLFWKAMVLDDRLNDKDRAKEVYEQIIKEYPNTPAAEQAKDAMKWTAKSDAEMIREFEKKNNLK